MGDTILAAIEAGDLEALEAMLAEDVPFDAQHLREACVCAPAFARLLLAAGADARALDESGRTLFDSLLLGRSYDHDPAERARCASDLLEAGVDPNADGDEPYLIGAIREGMIEIVRLLLEKGADPNAVASSGSAPLHVALECAQHEVIAMLLDRGADVNATDGLDRAPLHLAAAGVSAGRALDASIVSLLLEHGADANAIAEQGTVLAMARATGTEAIAEVLTGAGAKVSVKEPKSLADAILAVSEEATRKRAKPQTLEVADASGRTPLHLACLHAPELVPLLLELGADAAAVDKDKSTALLLLCRTGNGVSNAAVLRAAEALLDRGNDPNRPNAKGNLPLARLIASQRNERVPVLSLLIARGAKVDRVHDKLIHAGYTPLAIAASGGRRRMLEALLAAGAKTETKTKDGTTPLLATCKFLGIPSDAALAECIRILISHGADVSAVEAEKGRTTLHLASAPVGRPLCVRALLDGGASPNARDAAGATPLHHAARVRSIDIVKMLLAAGAELSLREREGKTPLDLAGGPELMSLLRAAGATNGAAASPFAHFGAKEGDREALADAVERYFDVVLHPSVRRFIVSDTDPKGWLPLARFDDCFAQHERLSKLFKRFRERWFPAIRLGSRHGIDVWLVLSNARVVTLHHDATFYEVAAEVKSRTAAAFVETFSKRGSAFDLDALLDLQVRSRDLTRGDPAYGESLFRVACMALETSELELRRRVENESALELLAVECHAWLAAPS